MGRFIKLVLFILLIVIGGFLLINADYSVVKGKLELAEVPEIQSNQVKKELSIQFAEGVLSYMDKSGDEIISLLGEPLRKDLTAYGYDWWIYYADEQYIQLGVKDNIVQTIFATGNKLNSSPFEIGTVYDELEINFPFLPKVTYKKGISHFSFILNEDDLKIQPLIMLGDELFVQCYFDTYTNKLSSIRIINGDLLTKQRFYEMEYRGTLPVVAELTEKEWKQVETGMEKQIFDLTNVYREKEGIEQLKYGEDVSNVAYKHSKDMYEKNYFSHESQDGRGLKERLEEQEIYYLAAGENIAAQHLDAPAAMEGWLNSEGHRETLLNEQYNYLGVGVHQLYYTQNFLLKP